MKPDQVTDNKGENRGEYNNSPYTITTLPSVTSLQCHIVRHRMIKD